MRENDDVVEEKYPGSKTLLIKPRTISGKRQKYLWQYKLWVWLFDIALNNRPPCTAKAIFNGKGSKANGSSYYNHLIIFKNSTIFVLDTQTFKV